VSPSRAFYVLLCLLTLLPGGIALSAGVASPTAEHNVVTNGGFEAGTSGWRLAPHGEGAFAVHDGTGRVDTRAAELASPAFGTAEVTQLVPVNPAAEYRLSGWVRVTEPGYPYITLQVGAPFSTPWPGGLLRPGTPDAAWQELRTDWIRPPLGTTFVAVTMRVQAGASTPGAPVHFDDIALEEKLPPEPTVAPTVTPTLPTATPTPVVDLSINEVLTSSRADPEGAGNGWIELFYEGEEMIFLENWRIDDSDPTTPPHRILNRYRMYSGDFMLLFYGETGLRLNPRGDVVRLYRPDGSLADEVTAPALDPDRSIGRYPDGGTALSTQWLPTPGESNGSRGAVPTPTPLPTSTPEPAPTSTPTPIPEPDPERVSIAEARSSSPGRQVHVEGTVTAPAHLLGAKRLYVQDSTGGILVVVPEETPTFAPGDILAVRGTTGSYFGERALRAETPGGGVLPTGSTDPLSAKHIASGEVGPATEGLLVQVAGELTEVAKPGVRVDDGSGAARVHIVDSTGIAWPSPRRGDTLAVVGIVSTFNRSYRVLPRYDADLTLTRPSEPPPPLVSVADARQSAPDRRVVIRGAVTAPPNLVGAGRMYVQDDSAGVLVIVPEDVRAFAPGDQVEIVGTTDTFFGERALRAEGAPRFRSRGQAPQPEVVPAAALAPSTEGSLVRLDGAVTGVAKPTIFVDDGSAEARVRIAESTGIPWPSPQKQDTVQAVGVVSSFNGTFRVLPRFADDLTLDRYQTPRQAPRDAMIHEARRATDGELLRIEGAVTAPPGVLGERLMYVQDSSGGILLTGELPPLRLGQVVRVVGTAGSYYSERRLIGSSVDVLRGGPPVAPRTVATSAVGAGTEGSLVQIQDVVSGSSWPTISLGEPPVRVRARESTGIANPHARRGDSATVVGIVSRRGDPHSVLLRFASDLQITHAPRGEGNGGSNPEPEPETEGWRDVSLAEARRLPLGTRVRFEAQVTAPPGVLGEARAYVGTAEAGMALHLVDGGYPALAEGDRVSARGTLDTYHGERILRLEDASGVTRLGSANPLAASALRTNQLGAATEGRFVRVQGTITRRQWPTLWVTDGMGEIRVRVVDTTGIGRIEGGKGDRITVRGMLSQWDGRYRLLPRYAADLRVTLAPGRADRPDEDDADGEKSVPSESEEETPPPCQEATIAEARQLALGTHVCFEAQVTAAPGVLGEARAYAGDQEAGIALHLPGGGYPALREGDAVDVRGALDTYHGERIVRLDDGRDVLRISAGKPLSATGVRTGGVGQATEGQLVRARATIAGRQWPTLFIDDGSGEARVRVLDSTGIPRLAGGKGDYAVIVGVVSQWDGRWRILPRVRRDIEITVMAMMPRTGGGGVAVSTHSSASRRHNIR